MKERTGTVPNKNLLFVGITGGIGAGKTTVIEYIKAHYPARILSADEIAKDFCKPGGECYDDLRRAFSDTSYWNADGTMNRETFTAEVFSDEEKRNRLNAIVHPAVNRYIIKEFEKEKQTGEHDYLILEAALLIEAHYDEICDELWYVYASEDTRRERLMRTRGYSKEKTDQIMKSQLPENRFHHVCERVIDNNGSEEEMIASIRKVFDEVNKPPAP